MGRNVELLRLSCDGVISLIAMQLSGRPSVLLHARLCSLALARFLNLPE